MEYKKPPKRGKIKQELKGVFVENLGRAIRDPRNAESYLGATFDQIEQLHYLLESGVYSNQEILQAIEEGHIVIHPFNPEHINTSSFDVTLGFNFYRTDKTTGYSHYVPFDEGHVERYFELHSAEPYEHVCHIKGWKPNENIPSEHPVIVLGSKERILAHTNEFIGINPPGTTSMQSRSTWGRNGISVCLDAGWGDSGFINRWTMEIYNWNNEPVALPAGERIAQIIFMHTGEVAGNYGEKGKYQPGIDLNQLMRDWNPEQMKPRAFKDKRERPLPILDLETGEEIHYEFGENIEEFVNA